MMNDNHQTSDRDKVAVATNHSDYTYWVKPIADRPNICSGYAKLNPFGAAAIFMENRLVDRGYTELTEEQAREWQYCSASDGSLRSVVQG